MRIDNNRVFNQDDDIREDYRVHVGSGFHLNVQLRTRKGLTIEGRLLNLSVGGCAMLMPLQTPVRLADIVTMTTLDWSRQNALRCNAQVRYLHHTPDGRELQMGLRFLDLEYHVKNRLFREILVLERELIRKRPPSAAEQATQACSVVSMW